MVLSLTISLIPYLGGLRKRFRGFVLEALKVRELGTQEGLAAWRLGLMELGCRFQEPCMVLIWAMMLGARNDVMMPHLMIG